MNKISERKNNLVCMGLILLILLPVCGVKGADNKPTLPELAQSKFDNINEAEEKLFQAVVNGELADYSDTSVEIDDPNNDPNNAKDWDKETRAIRADVVAWLCTDKEASSMVTHKGLWIKGARIDGELDLEFAEISFPLRFIKSVFFDCINLEKAQIQDIELIGTYTGPIYCYGLKVKGDVTLRTGFQANGEVNLVGARIDGILNCDGGQFINKGKIALNANSVNVSGSIFLRNGFKAEGEVNLVGARIEGTLECDKSQFINEKRIALDANRANISDSVYLRNGFHAEGEVNLVSATIGGVLDCDNTEFVDPNGYALNASIIDVKGDVSLSKGFKAEGEVNLIGATIGGNLDCSKGQFIDPNALNAGNIDVKGDVLLRNGFRAEGKVNLLGARIGRIFSCSNGKFINKEKIALDANRANIGDSVYLRNGFHAEGEVNLVSATIGGVLDCDNTEFINPNGYALNADSLNIVNSIFLHKCFKVEGEVCLVGATIGGNLECDGSQFINKGAKALDTNVANIGGSVFLIRDFKAEGEVNLMGATIGENLECTNIELINPNGNALNADDIDVKGNVYFRDNFQAEGNVNLVSAVINKYFVWKDVNSPKDVTLDLRSASIGVLYDEANSWPDPNRLLLHGLVYNEIDDDAPRNAKSRIDWLRRQTGFRSQPYEQLADVLRQSGQESEAKDILIAKNEHKAQLSQLTWWEKIWYRRLGPMIGYGYRPQKALWRMGIIIILGWIIFGIGYRRGLITPDSESHYVERGSGINIPWDDTRQLSKDYPRFSYFMYSIDVFVPLIDLHQAKYWLPNVNRGHELKINGYSLLHAGSIIRLYLWFHLIMGWTLTTMLVVGLTGLIRT
jgi:sRNA-binding regulator protein Hfq